MSVDRPARPTTPIEEPAIDTAELPPTRAGRRRAPRRAGVQRDELDLQAGDVHAQAADLLPRAVGRQRAAARQGLAALLRGARRLRPPHGERQRLHRAPRCPASCAASTPTTRSPGAGATSATTSWSTGSAGSGRAAYGGVDRPVVGAHTLGYNDYSFAMSAIGNFETAQPTSAMLAGLRQRCSPGSCRCTASTPRRPARASAADDFQAINGHRDAGQTACPGRYLYAKIPRIRELAATAPARTGPAASSQSDLAGTDHPDLVVRRASDGRASSCRPAAAQRLRTAGGQPGPGRRRRGRGLARPHRRRHGRPRRPRRATAAPRRPPGRRRRRVRRSGPQADAPSPASTWSPRSATSTSDGHNDLVARNPATGRLYVYLGTATGGFRRERVAGDWGGYNQLAATGDLDGDGKADLLARDTRGGLWLHPGTGTARLRRAGSRWPAAGAAYDAHHRLRRLHRRRRRRPLRPRGPGRRRAGSCPGTGDGRSAAPFGPIGRVRGRGAVSGAGTVRSATRLPGPGVARAAATVVTDRATSAPSTCGRPIPTGRDALGRRTPLLNVGDWDRDGYGDVDLPRRATVRCSCGAATARGQLRPPRSSIATGFGDVRPARGGGRHDRRRLARPDGPAGGASHADLPRRRPRRAADQLRRAQRDQRRPTRSASGRWDSDGAPDSLFRAGNRLTLSPATAPAG